MRAIRVEVRRYDWEAGAPRGEGIRLPLTSCLPRPALRAVATIEPIPTPRSGPRMPDDHADVTDELATRLERVKEYL